MVGEQRFARVVLCCGAYEGADASVKLVDVLPSLSISCSQVGEVGGVQPKVNPVSACTSGLSALTPSVPEAARQLTWASMIGWRHGPIAY